MQKLAKNYHYFYNANPYKSIESIKKFAHQECLYHDEEIAAFNKPPGFSLLGKMEGNMSVIFILILSLGIA